MKSKRGEDCDLVGQSCTDSSVAAECAVTTCEYKALACYPGTASDPGVCTQEEASNYRR